MAAARRTVETAKYRFPPTDIKTLLICGSQRETWRPARRHSRQASAPEEMLLHSFLFFHPNRDDVSVGFHQTKQRKPGRISGPVNLMNCDKLVLDLARDEEALISFLLK
ncbi:uncharacterized protein V6R79_010968 [Siganus canaliculatus]